MKHEKDVNELNEGISLTETFTKNKKMLQEIQFSLALIWCLLFILPSTHFGRQTFLVSVLFLLSFFCPGTIFNTLPSSSFSSSVTQKFDVFGVWWNVMCCDVKWLNRVLSISSRKKAWIWKKIFFPLETSFNFPKANEKRDESNKKFSSYETS